MPAWPATLPQSPLLDSYSEEAGDNVIRSPMDMGPPKRRRRFTARVDKLNLSYVMTTAQFATFETFWRTDLADGALPIDMNHPRTGVAISAVPSGPYTAARDGDTLDWRVELSVEIQP